MKEVGLGAPAASLSVYIGNLANYADLSSLTSIRGVKEGEISAISNACGNGWRKVFNVYAKLVFALDSEQKNWIGSSPNWQHFRDSTLLRAGSETSLLFSKPDLTNQPLQKRLHIVMGKGYANSVLENETLHWLDPYFAMIPDKHCIVCPYFDYRQLSNQKIIQLVDLIKQSIRVFVG